MFVGVQDMEEVNVKRLMLIAAAFPSNTQSSLSW